MSTTGVAARAYRSPSDEGRPAGAGAGQPLVVHVIHRLAVGGLENGLVNLLNHLPAERFRHAVVCLTDATDFAARIRRADVPIAELHKQPGNSLAIHARFHRLFRAWRPTIVHSRNLGALECQVGAWTARVPIRVHGEHGWDTSDLGGTSARFAAVRRLYSPFVHRYIALSGQIERYLHERVGIAPSRIERICNGVDCRRFQPSARAREAFPHPALRDPGLVLVGAVGRLEPVKDQLALARAFVAALARDPAARAYLRLVIVGSGSLRPAIEAVLADAGASDFAWLAGERDDVAALLPALDVFVLPSQAEGISNTLLEAMACGLPAIATDVGGNGELVEHGVSGELVRAGDVDAIADALLRLGRDPGQRRQLGATARERAVSRFSLDEMVRRYAALYERELDARAPRAAAFAGAAATHD
jgi:sugar transferase (PEP-CTERM/EpsH1 system associated)